MIDKTVVSALAADSARTLSTGTFLSIVGNETASSMVFACELANAFLKKEVITGTVIALTTCPPRLIRPLKGQLEVEADIDVVAVGGKRDCIATLEARVAKAFVDKKPTSVVILDEALTYPFTDVSIPTGYIKKLRDLAKQHNFLLIKMDGVFLESTCTEYVDAIKQNRHLLEVSEMCDQQLGIHYTHGKKKYYTKFVTKSRG